ncbi:MAG: NADH-quinone oxidoreductase subunit M, partial [Dehalococcoidia bacterium]|nr:NADH-quinone oxidoreductase subunit M [Dehalococcoidia bacterium]
LRWMRVLALGGAIGSAIPACVIFFAYRLDLGGFQFLETAPWLPDIGIRYSLGVDGISAPLLLLNGIVAITGVLASFRIQQRAKEYFALLLLLIAGVYGVFAATDLFFFFFFYEVAVLPMYLLIAVWGSSNKEYGALKLTMVLLAGSILVWVGLLIIYLSSGLQTFDFVALSTVSLPREAQLVAFPLLMIGFGVLAGLWPFHTWSPDGHVAAPTAVSMLHAGVLMKLGSYGILRIGLTLLPDGAEVWTPVLLVLGAINVLYGALSAMSQTDLKYVIGYSSVSHMGYVLMGIGSLSLLGLSGAVMQMFAHGVMTALFFACVGVLYDQAHTREIAAFGGILRRMPLIGGMFILAGLASLGLPGLSGFIAELLVFAGLFQSQPFVFGVAAVIGVALTAIYVLRVIKRVFFGPMPPRWMALRDGSLADVIAGLTLSAFLVALGVYPALMLAIIDSGLSPIMRRLGGLE